MSAELQPAWQVTTPSGGLDGYMLLIFGIMVLAGILGGAANYFLTDRRSDSGARDWVKYPVFGVIAALTVPVFLNMLSSTLLEGARTKPIDLYVFSGFCLIYVVASRRLFETVAQRLIGQLEQIRREAGRVEQLKRGELAGNAKSEVEAPKLVEHDPREVLTYHDVEILRALSAGGFVYGNLAAICDSTGLARDLVSNRLKVMKTMAVIETRINDKNVLHWIVSARGKSVLGEILGEAAEKKSA